MRLLRNISLATALILLAAVLPHRGSALAQGKTSSKSSSSDVSKKVGYAGDPARKRGMEIGFDHGKKMGKSDKDKNLKPDLKRHEAYLQPEKYYRHEYGSQGSFVSGFKSGFSGGYQAAFGKKMPLSADGTQPKTKTTPTPRKGGGVASDAL